MPEMSNPTRRRFLKRAVGTIMVSGLGALLYAWRVEPHWVQIVKRELPIANLPPGMVGRTLVQLSDLHAGPNVDENYLVRAMGTVSDLDADLIVITGDFMTFAGEQSVQAAQRVLSHLKPARLATLGVLGNHDYGRRFSEPAVAARLIDALSDLGITFLRNEMTNVNGLQIAGIDDVWGPNFAPDKVMPQIDKNGAAIVLCHNPDVADQPVWHGYKGWVLCGHTHGGQCSAPLIGPPILPVKNKRFTSGEIDLRDGRRLYINRGLGHLQRVRFNARPEITVFTLIGVSSSSIVPTTPTSQATQ